jgi:hypothetical protein
LKKAGKKACEKSKASQVRDALRDGPKTRDQLHALVRSIHRNTINSALLDMCNAGAVESDGGLFWLHHSIVTEKDYMWFMRALRRPPEPVPDAPEIPGMVVGAAVDAALRAWR